jgi:uncharacterized protein YndB with AHSA1/START domain
LSRWFGPGTVEVVEASADVRVGGRYRIAMREVGGEEHKVGGTYREVEDHKRLVFTWAWESMPERQSIVTVELKPDGGGTLVTLTHAQFADAEARDRHEHGWTGSFDKLVTLLEKD